jgi:hypothetical protein
MRRVDQADGADLDPNHELGSGGRGGGKGGKGGFRGAEVRQRAMPHVLWLCARECAMPACSISAHARLWGADGGMCAWSVRIRRVA